MPETPPPLPPTPADLLDLTYDAIFVRDLDSVITYWNRGAELMYGWTREQALGRVSHELLQTKFPPRDQQIDAIVLRDSVWEGELTHTRRGGRAVIVDSRQSLLRDESGQPVAILEANRDITDRKQAEAVRLQLAAIVESSDDAIIGKSMDGIITSWNRGAERIYGYTAKEAIGRPISILIPPDHPDELPSIMERLRLGQRVEPYETDRIARDGRRLRISLAISPLRDNDGRVAAAAVVARDITAQSRARTALAESETRFRRIVETANEGVWLIDSEARTLLANRRMAELLGTTVDDLFRRSVMEFCFPEDLPLAQDHVGRNLSGVSEEFDFRFRRGDGTAVLVLAGTSPVTNVRGEVIGALGMFSDITERKRNEAALTLLTEASAVLAGSLDYEATLQGLVGVMVPAFADWCVISIATEHGVLERLASAHRDPEKAVLLQEVLHRYPPALDGPHPVATVLRTGQPQVGVQEADALFETLAQSDEHLKMLRRLRPRSYLVVPLSVRDRTIGVISLFRGTAMTPFEGSDSAIAGEIARRGAMALENARLYRQTQEAVHVRDEFLSSVSHDLRTPLTTVRGMTQLVLRRLRRMATPDTEQMAVSLAEVESATGRMARMVEELLDVSRLGAGRPLDLNREETDLVPLANQIVSEQAHITSRHQITIDAAAPNLTGFWDSARLERVLANLLSNAVKYSPDGGPIRVSLARNESDTGCWAEVRVSDNGLGIPAADLPRVFERFHRASNVVDLTMGVGIGLSGAKQIVEQHGGTMEVESEEGRGATFTVRLPLTVDPPEEAAQK